MCPQRIHSYSEEQLKSLTLDSKQASNSSDGAKKRKTGSDGCPSTFFKKKKKITQKDVDDAVIKLLISATLPHHIVDRPEFKNAILLGLPEDLKVICRQSVKKRLDEYHDLMKSNIMRELQTVDFVASCADVWTKHHRAFLGMNITWIDSRTMERKAAAIALKRLRMRHTYQVLGAAMNKEYEKYGLLANGKLVKCTTDSASNSRKAFREYRSSSANRNEGN